MNCLDDEENHLDRTDDRFPSGQSNCTNPYSIEPTRTKLQRPTSLPPSRHSLPHSVLNSNESVKQRRRHASDPHAPNASVQLVTSFLQYLRQELRLTANDKTNDYYRQRARQKPSDKVDCLTRLCSPPIAMTLTLSNENPLANNDKNEILTLIDLLVLRVECLANESDGKPTNAAYPTVSKVDQNLIEYLYYLFAKFLRDESLTSTPTTPTMDKTNFVHVCQTLVRNGCFDLSPDQSSADTTISSDRTLTQQPSLHEYPSDQDTLVPEQQPPTEQDTWLVVDLEPTTSDDELANEESICLLSPSTSDEQLLLTTDNYKSCESESSHSIYCSPNSSLFDIQNIMVQELDEIHPSTTMNEDGSSSNVTIESKTMIFNDDDDDDDDDETPPESITNGNICAGLTNDQGPDERSEQMTMNSIDPMSRREKKMHERWLTATTTSSADKSHNHEQASKNVLLGVAFPPIAVLRRKFSSKPNTTETNTLGKLHADSSVESQKINTSPTTLVVDKANPDQTAELSSNGVPLTNSEITPSNDDRQLPVLVNPPTACPVDDDETMTKKTTHGSPLAYPPETSWNDDPTTTTTNYESNSPLMITNPSTRNSPVSSSNAAAAGLSSTTTKNAKKTIESLPSERKEKDEEEEEEKKNNSSFVHVGHAPGILLINDEPTQAALRRQEREGRKEDDDDDEERERPSSPLPTAEQIKQQPWTEDESPARNLPNSLKPLTTMAQVADDDDDERYKKVEIEEVVDDDEPVCAQSTEPTDYIHTDEEPRRPKPTTTTTTGDVVPPVKFDHVLSCYEKALAKVVDTLDESAPSSSSSTVLSNGVHQQPVTSSSGATTNQRFDNDPIALRALQRFEERMNAVTAKTSRDEAAMAAALMAKGKSSWSGSLSAPRKSLENLFKHTEPRISAVDEPITTSPDGYIRARKTFDDHSHNYGMTRSLYETSSTIDEANDVDHQQPQQENPPLVPENNDDKRVSERKSTAMADQTTASDHPPAHETETLHQLVPTPSPSTTVVAPTSLTGSTSPMPYHIQLEGRRRLNTLERLRERRQSREALDTIEQQQPIHNDYTVKTDDVQDPIIRRALERFDEKNRALTQTKSTDYDDIQDPITRRALMRLESNLKRANPPPPPPPPTETNDTWYTNNYTLGSLQPSNDRPSRYADISQSPAVNKATYVSAHPRYGVPSSTEVSTEQQIIGARVPAQPLHTSVNSYSQPISFRQRSRSEDMLASRDLSIGQTTDLDQAVTSTAADASQLQRNRSSNEIPISQPGFQLPSTIIKAIEPNFVRTTESSVSYATPTQTYSSYSCEYTRPRRALIGTSSEASATVKQEPTALPAPKYVPQQTEISRPTPYRPAVETQYQPSSAFAPVRAAPSVPTTTTSNYYNQPPIPTPSYGSAYTPAAPHQTSYAEDPIVRRALDRYNSQVQGSLMGNSQYQPSSNYYTQQNNAHDTWMNPNHSALANTVSGYQSIIGRRRQTRYDDPHGALADNSSIGDGYSSSVFAQQQNPYGTSKHYMNMSDEPPALPPRYRRENYRPEEFHDLYRRHSTDDYLSENTNNNNSNIFPQETFIHHAYPATITNATSFRPINIHYNQPYDSYTEIPVEQDDIRDRAQSTSSTNSADSQKQRLNKTSSNGQPRYPSSAVPARTNGRRANEQTTRNRSSPDASQLLTDPPTPNNGNVPNDSVFHRLAYTGTKASLSKSSSNSCSNLLNKSPHGAALNPMKSCEIDLDDSSSATTTAPADNTQNDQMSSSSNKYQRSKSVDSRARLKIVQARANNSTQSTSIDLDETFDEPHKPVSSSKFNSIQVRRAPLTPTSSSRSLTTKRPSIGSSSNTLYPKHSNGMQTRGSYANLHDSDNAENDENLSVNDHFHSKIVDNRTRTALPVQRYPQNPIQTSASTSAVSGTLSRPKPSMSYDRRDSNASITDLHRISKRSEDNRLLSPPGQRRNVPVSVFAPARLENKRPAPAPPSSAYESHQEPSVYSSRSSAMDSGYAPVASDTELNHKRSSRTFHGLKPSGGVLQNEYSPSTSDKTDSTAGKKMNVFERLFRGNKKKN